MSPCRAYACLLLLCWCVAPSLAWAQYDVEQEQRVWLRALLDVRVARGGSAPSWTDLGPGKTRYGGKSTAEGFERVTRGVLSQLAIEVGASLPGDIRAQLQVNVQPDIADNWDPWLIEALLRKEWGAANGFGLQVGLMNVPFSLEHVGPAWSPEYSISASALDSWLWEEISLAGVEGEWWHVTPGGLRLGAIFGAGFGPDQLGRVVALRGWALGDGLSGVNSDLPLPSGERTDIFDERDDRPAAYTWLTIGDAKERATLRLGYLDNGGDQDVEGVWNTHFSTIGAILHPHPSIDLLIQYLRGEARIRDRTNDSSLRAFYALLSHHRGRHRFSVRYDEFRVDDRDEGNPTVERGDGITAAYFLELGLRHRIGLEYIWLDSRRPSRVPPEPSQDGWQVSYRFRY
jgi:hypothetical protein